MGERTHLADLGGYRPGRSLIKRSEIRLKPSSQKGIFVGKVIGNETGFNNATTTLDIYHIPPGANTQSHRHDDALVHVLSGRGRSVIDGVKYEWEPGDTIHIKPGVWHQHWNTSRDGANMLVARALPLLNHVKPFVLGNRGDAYVELGDYVPDHPFGLGKTPLAVEEGETWRGPFEVYWEQTKKAWARRMKEARTMMKGRDVRYECGETHRGEFNAMLADGSLGFDTRLITMGIQTLPPGGRNETHAHMEAIVYALKGRGLVLVNDEQFEMQEGDCAFVHMGDWHQFRAYPGDSEPFVQMRILTRALTDLYLFPFPWIEDDDDAPASGADANYVPKLPWE